MVDRARAALLGVSGALLVLAAALPVWLWRGELPARLATHFNLRGTPDGSMPPGAFAMVMTALAMLGFALMVLAMWQVERSARAAMAGAGAYGTSLMALLSVWVAAANRGASHWQEVRAPSPFDLLWIVALAFLVAWAASRAVLSGANGASPDAAAPVSLGLRDGENATWVRRLTAPWAHILAAVCAALAAGGLIYGQHLVLATGVGLSALSVVMSSIRVVVDVRGLSVHWGPGGLIRSRVALADIQKAEPIHVNPLEWGGWGYRGSLRLFGRAAIVLRGGPGLSLELRRGRVLVVTIDDAITAAGLLNDLIARQRDT